MWQENIVPFLPGKRDLIIGEDLRGVPDHPRTRYIGPGSIGSDSNGFQETGTTCMNHSARVVRKWTTERTDVLGTISYVGFGLAICTDPECDYPIPVHIEGIDTLVGIFPSPNRP